MCAENFFEPPTEKQIKFVGIICEKLDIEFPTCSKDFTKTNYTKFIEKNIVEFYKSTRNIYLDEDDLYRICENDVWGEYY